MNSIGVLLTWIMPNKPQSEQEDIITSDLVAQELDPENNDNFYSQMTIDQMKAHIYGNLAVTGAMMRSAQAEYARDGDLQLVSDLYDRVIEWVPGFVSKIFDILSTIDDPTLYRQYFIRFTINVRLYYTIAKVAADNRQRQTAAAGCWLPVTDTEENLAIKLNQIQRKQLSKLNKAIKFFTKKGNPVFATIHQTVIEFFNKEFSLLNQGIQELPTSAIRAKNMQLLCMDLVLAR